MLVFALIAVGTLGVMLSASWGGLWMSALSFALALWLGAKLDKRNLLPS
jgi:hypothetical protein